ncbi:hypothetical protein [Amycolatopsis saalfeldensis]|uniref:Uncharacterized protein n=1 Tax=Amycolatopsis saalfeldensis TaxID=394193 RepID=A0A1H8X349_9PSEU|nr:hypothetical protein [Amycolatopsis saalfeldensis]SEP34352.1 hypothetical protein SAMN04489732_106224 [Amycolatopsis saalfeldensis]
MSRGKGTDGPEDVDATFAEIVADLRAEGVGVFAEDALEVAEDTAADRPSDTSPPSTPPAKQDKPAEPSEGWRGGGTTWDATMFSDDPAEDDEHFVPPEPPPLPRPRKGAFVVLLFFVVGLLLLIVPNLIGVSPSLSMPLGILALATAIALLLLRVRQGPPPGADPHNGAQV